MLQNRQVQWSNSPPRAPYQFGPIEWLWRTLMAAHFDLKLPATPRDMTNGAVLRDEFVVGEWLPKA
jgi:transposase InsO family protein